MVEQSAARRFLAPSTIPTITKKISDVLDVWFDSGCTHAFVLEDPKAFPTLGAFIASATAAPTRSCILKLGPASRLVPFLAARILRHALPRAL